MNATSRGDKITIKRSPGTPGHRNKTEEMGKRLHLLKKMVAK
jgi:hypothetical protein